MGFKLTQIGNTRGDCTAEYSVDLDKEMTLNEFIDEVLSRTREWGYIGIKYSPYTIFGDTKCEYAYGQFKGPGKEVFSENELNRKIRHICANGGWSRMDYLISF